MKTERKQIKSGPRVSGALEIKTFESYQDAIDSGFDEATIIGLANASLTIAQQDVARVAMSKDHSIGDDELQRLIDEKLHAIKEGIRRARGAVKVDPVKTTLSVKDQILKEANGDVDLAEKMFLKWLRDHGLIR